MKLHRSQTTAAKSRNANYAATAVDAPTLDALPLPHHLYNIQYVSFHSNQSLRNEEQSGYTSSARYLPRPVDAPVPPALQLYLPHQSSISISPTALPATAVDDELPVEFTLPLPFCST